MRGWRPGRRRRAPGALSADNWDPAQYNRFAAERARPFWDLVELLRPVDRPIAVDLGCGDGRLTAALHSKIGAERTTGIDRSSAMLSAARSMAGDGLTFELGDLGEWDEPGSVDIVVANASLHWVPDHHTLLGRWTRSLRPGGQLAVQVPANADHPSHVIAAETAAELIADPPPDPVRTNVLAPEQYAVLLDELNFTHQHVRLQVYAHRLESTDELVEWVKGTSLTRFKDALGAEGWEELVVRYRERLVGALGDRAPILYPFKRILMWGG